MIWMSPGELTPQTSGRRSSQPGKIGSACDKLLLLPTCLGVLKQPTLEFLKGFKGLRKGKGCPGHQACPKR